MSDVTLTALAVYLADFGPIPEPFESEIAELVVRLHVEAFIERAARNGWDRSVHYHGIDLRGTKICEMHSGAVDGDGAAQKSSSRAVPVDPTTAATS